MFSKTDAIEVLKEARKFDQRLQPDPLVRDAWHDVGNRASWTVAEAIEAVREHYTESTEWIKPGHVTARILAQRHQARPSSPSARPLGDVLLQRNPDEVITAENDRREFLANIRGILAVKGSDLEADDAEPATPTDPTDDGDACLDVACPWPWCHAPIGSRCTTRGRPMRRRACHPARKLAKVERSSHAE